MAVTVYPWPPVGATAAEWTVSDPVSRSTSLITGRRYVSAAKRRRRLATLQVQAQFRDAAGYMEALKRLLQGGVNLVRLTGYPVNRGEAVASGAAELGYPLGWQMPEPPLGWQVAGAPLVWAIAGGLPASPIASADGPVVRVESLAPSSPVIRPGEFVVVTLATGAVESRMATAPATSNAAGVAFIRVDSGISGDGTAVLTDRETGVFEALEMPRAVRPFAGGWEYGWAFREVFGDEVDGGFEERNPWA